MRYVLVQSGRVVAVSVRNNARSLAGWIVSDTAQIGDLHENGAFIPTVKVPQQVTMRQARQALILSGMDEQVEAALAAIEGIPGKLARAEWEKSQVVERNRPLVLQMGAALGLTEADLDQLFILAGTL